MPSTTSCAALFCCLASALAPLSARAAGAIVDKETGTRFHPDQTIGATTFQCVGAGVRKVFIVNVYAAEFCLEQGSLRPALDYVASARAGGGSPSDVADRLASEPALFKTLVDVPGGKLLIMHLVRDITREDLAKAFRESLAKVLPPEKVEKLVSIIPGDPKKSQDVKLSSAGDTLTIDIAGHTNKVDDAQIAQNIWWVWLGKDSVSPSLKESIAKHLVEGL